MMMYRLTYRDFLIIFWRKSSLADTYHYRSISYYLDWSSDLHTVLIDIYSHIYPKNYRTSHSSYISEFIHVLWHISLFSYDATYALAFLWNELIFHRSKSRRMSKASLKRLTLITRFSILSKRFSYFYTFHYAWLCVF